MRWRLGEGLAAGSLALLIALLPYMSAAERQVFGRWSYVYAGLLGVVLLVFIGAVLVLLRPPAGPIDGGWHATGPRVVAKSFDLGFALWGVGYLVGALFDPVSRARLLEFDFLMSSVPAASLLEWGGAAIFAFGIGAFLWSKFAERSLATAITLCTLVGVVTLGEGVARWGASYRPRPTPIRSAASERWDRLHIQLDESGFRDRQHAVVALPGTSRLLVVGGDDAFGVGIEENRDRLGEETASRLEPLTEGLWEGVNVAQRGSRTPGQVADLEQGLRYSPRVVILYYSFEDGEYLAPVRHRNAPGAGGSGWRARLDPSYLLYTNSVLYQEAMIRVPPFLDRLSGDDRPAPDVTADSTLLDAHLADLTRLVAAAADTGRVVMIVPVDVETATDLKRRSRYRIFMTRAQAVGLPVWSTERAFAGHTTSELIVSPLVRRPNELANELVAELLAAELKVRLAPKVAVPMETLVR